MRSKLLPYKIGLGVISVFTLIILVVVLIGASNYRYDNQLNVQANNISTTLNDYTNSQQTIPDNLTVAGVTNVPSGISYTKLSDSSYKFCINYRAASSGFSASQLEQQLITSSLYSSSGGSSTLPADNTSLYVSPYYHKGENCQTITPLTDPYAKCDSIIDNTAYTNCINQVNNQSNTQLE